MPRGIAKTAKPCAHCAEVHHRMATCADGWRDPRYATKRFGIERSPVTKGAKQEDAAAALEPQTGSPDALDIPTASPEAPEAPTAQVEPPASPLLSEAEQAREDLRLMIAALPEDSPQRASLQRLLDRDQARAQHAQAERDLQSRTGNPEARLPLPTIIRDRTEDKGRFLEGELSRVLASAGEARDPRARPPLHEVMATKEFFATKDARDEQKAVEEIMRTASLEGGQNWICRSPACGERFKSASMDEVRRYAKEHPGWLFVCPTCKSPRVELIQMAVAS